MNVLLQFFFGGLTVVGMTSVARLLHPKFAGLVYALPAVLIVAATFVFLGQGLPATREVLRSTLLYSPALVVFAGGFFFILKAWDFWPSLAAALVLWLFSVVLIYLTCR